MSLMMRFDLENKGTFGRSVVIVVAALVFCGLLLSSAFAAVQNRPRSAQTAPAKPTPTPTPAPVTTTPTTAPQTSATPTPTPKPTGGAPTLGEAPPPPRLRPTPTPTPPEEIDAESTIKINADLVQLHVRVIDRNNRPIDNVPQSDFHVFEDGEPQPI
jgi:hypothetical protein